MRRLVYATLMLGVLSGSAVAGEWRYQRVEDTFQGDNYTAMVKTGKMLAGFQCKDFFDITFSFITPERAKDGETVNGKATIAYIVDDAEPVEIEAELFVGGTGFYIFDATDKGLRNAETSAVVNFARRVVTAKKRFAVAGKMNGQIIYSNNFEIAEVSKALGQLLAGCQYATDNMKGGRFPAEK
ncbi:hypothetical protein [Hyphomicrobium sp.]|uniref:hypothetical protein n=1 Tax=Hyphomicrobium sp. TaxID=82 RepID=UPI000F91373D|nr:hypothetical protein [Hyphomicrobium sp.]RUP10311.1 MAG: hypothetical protein EKK38_07765 [Hyphomicrobium sp.]